MFAKFHLKDFILLKCYVLRKLVLKILNCWKMLEIYLVGRYWFNDILLYFERFYVIWRFRLV